MFVDIVCDMNYVFFHAEVLVKSGTKAFDYMNYWVIPSEPRTDRVTPLPPLVVFVVENN